MKEKSIYDYLQENIDSNGKISADCHLTNYLATIYEREFKLSSSNAYYEFNKWDNFDYSSIFETKVEKIDFQLYAVLQKTLSSLDSENLEKYLFGKELDIRMIASQLIDTIEKNIENVDKSKLSIFCLQNIQKTQNMYCIYIYLLLSSYTNLKDDEKLQNIILKIGLLPEYSLFLNDFILDNFSQPEYYRFYLAKRILDENNIIELIDKINFTSNDIKIWALENVTHKYNPGKVIKIIRKLDLNKLIKKIEITSKTYDYINSTLKNIIDYADDRENIDEFEKSFIAHIKNYSKISLTIENFWSTTNLYKKIYESQIAFSKDTKEKIIKEYKKVLVTDKTIELIKQILSDPTSRIRSSICEAVVALNISELYLNLFNEYKSNPQKNTFFLYIFKDKPELLKQALKILDNATDWESIIGEYSCIRINSTYFDSTMSLISNAYKFPDIAMSIYSKTLRAKKVEYRQQTLHYIHSLLMEHDMSYLSLSKELRDNIEYLYNHEPDVDTKKSAGCMLGLDDCYDDLPYEAQKRRKEISKKLNLINKNDDELLEKKKEEENNKNKKVVINLNSHIFRKIFDQKNCGNGLNILNSKKVIYIKREKNNVISWCQGDEFGKEYIVRLKGDENDDLIDSSCTCGKNSANEFCKHVCATLLYISKLNDMKNEDTST